MFVTIGNTVQTTLSSSQAILCGNIFGELVKLEWVHFESSPPKITQNVHVSGTIERKCVIVLHP